MNSVAALGKIVPHVGIGIGIVQTTIILMLGHRIFGVPSNSKFEALVNRRSRLQPVDAPAWAVSR